MAGWTWTGAAGDGNFNTAANWNPASVPNNSQDDVSIPAGVTISLANAILVNNLTITGTGTLTFTGGYAISVNNNVTFSAAGEALALGGSTLTSTGNLILPSGAGTFTVSGGTINFAQAANVAAGQTLVLTDVTFSTGTSGGFTGTGTVELQGSSVTLTGGSAPTTSFVFEQVASGGTGNTLTLSDYYTGLTISGFGYGDRIYYGSGNTLQLVSNGDGTYTLQDNHGSWTASIATVTLASGTNPSDFTMSDGYFVYTGSAPCFTVGTMIATPAGEVAVENLRAGELVLTADGRALPVRWLGMSRVATRFADPLRALPIRIAAGALGGSLPVRDLLVSPDHAMFLDGVLVQAAALVGFPGITREYGMPDVFNYYHVELETHELLLAEGAPAESFVDNIDRMNFHNWDERSAPVEPIAEMEYPRAKSARQLPSGLRARLGVQAKAA